MPFSTPPSPVTRYGYSITMHQQIFSSSEGADFQFHVVMESLIYNPSTIEPTESAQDAVAQQFLDYLAAWPGVDGAEGELSVTGIKSLVMYGGTSEITPTT